jgi:Hydrophobic surface binding protein A
MKFSSALTFLAVSGAASASILERQVATIIGVVNGINTVVGDLDTTVKGFSGDPKALLAASQKAQDAVSKGVETVNAASSITLTDSVQIQGQVQNLQSSLESVVSDLISKKEALITAGQGQTVYKSLQDQLTGAKALQVAISSKVPPEVKSLAETLSAGINTALEKGISAFKDAPAGSSDASASGGSSAPSSGSASSGSSAPAAGGASSSGSSSSGASSGSASSGSSGSSSGSSGAAAAGGASGAKPATATVSSAPKPATYTGAAAPRAVAGSFAVAAALAVVFAL